MNQLDPNKQYIGAGLELTEARILKVVLTTFHNDHPDFYTEFVTKLRDALGYQIDNELTLPGDILSAMMGMAQTAEEQWVPDDDRERVVPDLKPEDLIVESYRPGGGGGFINKPDTGVKITHKPTGLSYSCDEDRSQHRNKAVAYRELAKMVDDYNNGRAWHTV